MKTEFYESEILVKTKELFPRPADEPKEILRKKWLLDGDMTFDQAKKIATVLAETVNEKRQVSVKVQNTVDKDWMETLYYVQGKMAQTPESAEQEAKDATNPQGRKPKGGTLLNLPEGGGGVPPKHKQRDN
jgi:hypothetical protein